MDKVHLIELTMDDVCQHVIDRGREQWAKIKVDNSMDGKEE